MSDLEQQQEPRWVRVSVTVADDPDRALDRATRLELAADALWRFGPAAIEERPGTGTGEGGPEHATVLLAGFDSLDVAASAADHLAGTDLGEVHLLHGDDPELDLWLEDGLDSWRGWAAPVAAGPFWVVPTWLAADHPTPDGQVRLLVDPSHTFGSGSHPTTRLVLARLAGLLGPTDTVLDVGSGSGILAVGAALLGAREVIGIDIDPGTPAATEANARANHVADRVSASCTPLTDLARDLLERGGGFTIVVANLLAPVIRELADDLAAVVRPGGALVVSGLLEDRWEETTSTFTSTFTSTSTSAGTGDPAWSVEQVDAEDGWVAVTLRADSGRGSG